MTKQQARAIRQQVTGVADGNENRSGIMLVQGMFSYVPQNAGAYVRISDDPHGLERGVNRQIDDCHKKAAHDGWKIGKVYTENDTSAYRKKKTTLPDGTVVWRGKPPPGGGQAFRPYPAPPERGT